MKNALKSGIHAFSVAEDGLCQYLHAFRQRLEPHPVRLRHGDRHMARLAHVDIPHDAGFSFMSAVDDFAHSAVCDLMIGFGGHVYIVIKKSVPNEHYLGSLKECLIICRNAILPLFVLKYDSRLNASRSSLKAS